MSYSYANVGNALSITDRINGTVDNTTSQQYDALNRLTVNTQGNKRVDYAYNAISQVTNKKRSNYKFKIERDQKSEII
jgi:hypothetical protein